MYRISLDQKFLEAHKKKIGIEGNWESYFDLFKLALDKNGVSLLRDEQKNVIVKISYPLIEGSCISGPMLMRPS